MNLKRNARNLFNNQNLLNAKVEYDHLKCNLDEKTLIEVKSGYKVEHRRIFQDDQGNGFDLQVYSEIFPTLEAAQDCFKDLTKEP